MQLTWYISFNQLLINLMPLLEKGRELKAFCNSVVWVLATIMTNVGARRTEDQRQFRLIAIFYCSRWKFDYHSTSAMFYSNRQVNALPG